MQSQNDASSLPAGWFQIGWSYQLDRGDVRPLRYFGEDLVLCRYESGDLGLFDAYCPHLNAHIGYGGQVLGERLACPYHGWQFDRDGCNVHIPYSDRVNRAQCLRKWDVVELGDSVILAWHSPDGSAPAFPAPSGDALIGLGKEEFFSVGPETSKRYENLTMKVEFVSENTVDMSHFKFVHETPEVGRILELDPIDHRLDVRFSMPMKIYDEETGGGIVDSVTETTNWGLGLVIARLGDGGTLLQAQTPIDDERCDLMLTIVLPRDGSESAVPTGAKAGRIKMAWRQIENDLVIWTHRRADAPSHLIADEVAPFNTFRKWSRQFFVDAASE